MERLLTLIEKRRAKKARRLLLPVNFWTQAWDFGACFALSMKDHELSKDEFDLLIEKFGELIKLVRNSNEAKDA